MTDITTGEFLVLDTGETVTGTLAGTDEMFCGSRFYHLLYTDDGHMYFAYYDEDDQPDALDEYGNLILDKIDYDHISELEEVYSEDTIDLLLEEYFA